MQNTVKQHISGTIELNFDNGESVRFYVENGAMQVRHGAECHRMGADEFVDFLFIISNQESRNETKNRN